jgi:tetratricopeptide (TPR) repeat protein
MTSKDATEKFLDLGGRAAIARRFDEAVAEYERALELSAGIGDPSGEGWALCGLAQVAGGQDRFDETRRRFEEARAKFEQARALFREEGDRTAEAWAIYGLAHVARRQHRFAEARKQFGEAQAQFERAGELFREEGDRDGEAWTLYGLGMIAWDQGRYDNARIRFERGLGLFRMVGDTGGEAQTLEGLVASTPMNSWPTYSYSEVFAACFSSAECERVIALHQGTGALRSTFPGVRDSDLFWVQRITETEWIFQRVWDIVTLYNSKYRFALSGDMGGLQLTRYTAGQRYDWHMDLGDGPPSLRKISVVIELAAGGYEGGGTEVFYGEGRDNRIALGTGDALVFPSFIMHRALPVHSGTRWTLVSWLTGPEPLR